MTAFNRRQILAGGTLAGAATLTSGRAWAQAPAPGAGRGPPPATR
jgi:hypothetical protein